MSDTSTTTGMPSVVDYGRGLGFYSPADRDRVTIVGCGGIGSPLALALAKMGVPDITLVDGDTVEPHNLPNQMFRLADLGRPKVNACADLIGEFTDAVTVTPARGFLRPDGLHVPGGDIVQQHLSGVVVLALDSIDARREIYENFLKYNMQVSLVVDPRLGGENVVVHSFDPRVPAECKAYEESLFSAEEAEEAPCTMRSIIDVGFCVSSLVTRAVRRHLSDRLGGNHEPMIWWSQNSLQVMR